MKALDSLILAAVLLISCPLLAQKKEKEKETIHLSQELSDNSTPIKVKFGTNITKPNMSAGPIESLRQRINGQRINSNQIFGEQNLR